MSDEATTFHMPLAGREVEFRRAKLGQILILQRTAQRLVQMAQGNPKDQGKALTDAIIKTLDFVENLIVSADDRQFVEDQMLLGTIDYQDIIAALGGRPDEPADDEAPRPVKRVPRKGAKAAPVDLTGKKPAQIVPKTTKAAPRARTKR